MYENTYYLQSYLIKANFHINNGSFRITRHAKKMNNVHIWNDKIVWNIFSFVSKEDHVGHGKSRIYSK